MSTTKLTVYYDYELRDTSGIIVMDHDYEGQDKMMTAFVGEAADKFFRILCDQELAQAAINSIDWNNYYRTGEVEKEDP